jgi:hypothetical protein
MARSIAAEDCKTVNLTPSDPLTAHLGQDRRLRVDHDVVL